MRSAVYRGRVRHRRFTAPAHAFEYTLFALYVDLAEMDRVFDSRWLWSSRGPNAMWLRRRDLLGDPALPLDACVRDRVESACGRRPAGPIRVLTMPRAWGLGFNPVSFYYCWDAADREVETVVAEVTNTPWLERHAYVLHAGIDEARAPRHRYRFRKDFHVSPFLPMDLDYDWRFTDPGDTLAVHMDVRRGADVAFDATLTMERRAWSGGALAAALAAHPWMTAKAVAGIYWNAFRLWTKRAEFFAHPSKPAAEAPR